MTAELRSRAATTRRAHRARALVTEAFAPLESVALATVLEQAELQTRLDLKYLVPLDRFAELVDALATDYAALEIDGRRLFRYESVYFDTADRLLYRHHLQGRRNRCKVRTRTYLDSGTCMLEVKQDGRRSVTVKTRVPHPIDEAGQLAPAARAHVDSVLQGRSGVAAGDLDASATTAYLRGTLVDLAAGSRLTCDLDLHCRQDGRVETGLTDHVLIETKSVAGRSVADRTLRAMGIRPLAVSKYCVAIALLDPNLPANRWNRVLRHYFDWTPGSRRHPAGVASR